MNPYDHSLGAIYPHRPSVPTHGDPLLKLATEQAADHRRICAERVVARQRTLPPLDDRRAELTQQLRNQLRTSEAWRNDLVCEATVGREERIIAAFMLGDIAEMGAILNEGLTAEFLAVIDKRVRAES